MYIKFFEAVRTANVIASNSINNIFYGTENIAVRRKKTVA